jgi:methionyl aminopeptidase
MSLVKTHSELVEIRKAGKKLAGVLRLAQESTKAGISLLELDRIIHEAILAEDSRPSFLGYDGYPNASCLSLNDQVVHGIPDRRVLKEGDVLGIDVGLWYGTVCVDAAITVAIEPISKEVQLLIRETKNALTAGVNTVKPFRRIGSISYAVQQVADKYGLGIVKNLTGHGVGNAVHEEPSIPNFGQPGDGMMIRPGMVLAIEPMFTLGSGSVQTEIDGWGVVTSDHTMAAHFEHTVIVTEKGKEVVTQ